MNTPVITSHAYKKKLSPLQIFTHHQGPLNLNDQLYFNKTPLKENTHEIQHILSYHDRIPIHTFLTWLKRKGFFFVGPSKRYVWRYGQLNDHILGNGYTSTVHLGVDCLKGCYVAVKIVPKNKQRPITTDVYYRQLYSHLCKIRHHNILHLHDYFEDDYNFYVISDLCNGSNLVDFVLSFKNQSIPIKCIRNIIFQVLLGLHHLHSENILHRDLKLDNILFLDSTHTRVNIIDFDMSTHQCPESCNTYYNDTPHSNSEMTVVGTKDYMAPECYYGQYNESSDLWSVGIILYILIHGCFPFDFSIAKNNEEIRDILRCGTHFQSHLSFRYPLAIDLLKQLLIFNNKDRLQTAWDTLYHPWFSEKIEKYSPYYETSSILHYPAPTISIEKRKMSDNIIFSQLTRLSQSIPSRSSKVAQSSKNQIKKTYTTNHLQPLRIGENQLNNPPFIRTTITPLKDNCSFQTNKMTNTLLYNCLMNCVAQKKISCYKDVLSELNKIKRRYLNNKQNLLKSTQPYVIHNFKTIRLNNTKYSESIQKMNSFIQ